MSILSVDNISPIGSGTSVTVNSAATLVVNNVSVAGVSTFTGNVIVDNGTVRCNDGFSSDVDLIFNADANNNGTGSIIFKESGSEKLRITSGGNVGINFTAPTAKLEVAASNQAGLRIIDSHTNQSAPYIEVIGKRTGVNNSQCFGGQIFLAGNVTDAKVHSGKTLGAVLFGGNHTDGSLSNIAYPASIAGVSGGSFDSVTDMPLSLIHI